MSTDRRLIEAGFPCHQVGAETQRERDTGKAPPTHRLHVWWARRPLTPSRAAILGSILPAETDPGEFLQELGIAQYYIEIGDTTVVLPESILDNHKQTTIFLDNELQRYLDSEKKLRKENRELIRSMISQATELKADPVIQTWVEMSEDFRVPEPFETSEYRVYKRPANPAWFKELMAIAGSMGIRVPNMYGYDRAYKDDAISRYPHVMVLDPTAGGGSIPFEAMRLGCKVISNDLNPVASVIQHATLTYPQHYGMDLTKDIQEYGSLLLDTVNDKMSSHYHFSQNIPPEQQYFLEDNLGKNKALAKDFLQEHPMTYLYCRMVTCPNCQGKAPLLNASWLSKSGDKWAVRVVTDGKMRKGSVRFEPFQFKGSRGPNGEDPDFATVTRGVGTCIHCKQAIPSDEIKDQACGRSHHGTWWDELFCVAAVRYQPKLDKKGNIERYKSGERAGEIKTEKISFFRAPTEADRKAIEDAKQELNRRWDAWDREGIIPTERIPEGHKTAEPLRVGLGRWCDMFTPRQLLGHLTAIETLNKMKPQIVSVLGAEKARAVITYLQFAIDKCVDYNSRQTRWIPQRRSVSGTFGRHDFSLKWTFGEMIFSGPNSGLAWGLSQILDAYAGIADLVPENLANVPIILNGTAAHMDVRDSSVDVICIDPPYYNNVQYAELSDFFYVWQKRTLADQYPELFSRRLTNKQDEAVANPVREGSAADADREYERLMTEIFVECRRVLKRDGIMTVMFTHKTQEAWQTLTQALIESGWAITSAFPVDSEFADSMHQKNMAAAASSIFIACRPRLENRQTAIWAGFGGTGVAQEVRKAVRDGLDEFSPLHLNPVDEMVASYGRALQVLSENWPVLDGDTPVTPIRAMTEASSVVAQYQMTRLTHDRLRFNDLNPEAGFALTLFGIYGLGDIPYDDALSLAKSLNISLENKLAGYMVRGRMTGINPERSGRSAQAGEDTGYYAPLVSRGSKLRLVAPDDRNGHRLEEPQTEWDLLQGIITAFQKGDIPLVRAYIAHHAPQKEQMLIDLTTVWTDNIADDKLKREASRLLYGLKL